MKIPIKREWKNIKIRCPDDIGEIFIQIISELDEFEKDKEHVWTVGIKSSGKVAYIEMNFIGSLNNCQYHPREIFRKAIHVAANSIFVAHNHPSNDLTPSREDYVMLEKLTDAGKIIGIPVLDSLIFKSEGNEFYSTVSNERFIYRGGSND